MCRGKFAIKVNNFKHGYKKSNLIIDNQINECYSEYIKLIVNNQRRKWA